MSEILITPDVCMRFLIWSYYYHGIQPRPGQSYADCGLFSPNDALRLDEIQQALFRCFEPQSVENACMQFRLARERQEPCPFTQSELDSMFATPLAR